MCRHLELNRGVCSKSGVGPGPSPTRRPSTTFVATASGLIVGKECGGGGDIVREADVRKVRLVVETFIDGDKNQIQKRWTSILIGTSTSNTCYMPRELAEMPKSMEVYKNTPCYSGPRSKSKSNPASQRHFHISSTTVLPASCLHTFSHQNTSHIVAPQPSLTQETKPPVFTLPSQDSRPGYSPWTQCSPPSSTPSS